MKEGNEGARDESLKVKWQKSQEMRLRELREQVSNGVFEVGDSHETM